MYKGKFASELSMCEVKEYYDELRQRCPRTDEQWADFNILKEKLIAFAYKILDGKTNGDVIKAMFKGRDLSVITERLEHTHWWNAKYKAEGSTDKE